MNSKGTNKWIITVTMMIGTIMSALDTSIVNVAIPYMRGNLGATVEEITWVVTGYILSNVIIMPIVGLLCTLFGRRNFYLFSVLLFTVASMLCGMAWSLSSMVVFRIIQGIGGGALIPVAQAILRETFPPEEQGTAMGIYGFGIILGPAFGPTIGGWLTDHYSWPWIFYINVPIGILNILMVLEFIEDPPYLIRQKGKIDFLGLVLMTIGLGALQVMLEKGEQKNWFESSFIIYLTIISFFTLVSFIVRELYAENPAVDLRILKDVNFASGTLIGGILGIALFGSLFLLPLFLQQLLGYPAFDSGLALMPRSLAMAFAMPIAGSFYNKAGPKILISSGLAISAFSFYQLSCLSLNVGYWNLFFPQFIQGVGFSMIFVALSTAALATVDKSKMTAAAGLYNVTRQVFGSIGIAIVATQLDRGLGSYRSLLVGNITDYRDASYNRIRSLTEFMINSGYDPAIAQSKAYKILDGELMRQASMLAYNHIYLLVTFVLCSSIPFVFLLKGKVKGLKNKEVFEEVPID